VEAFILAETDDAMPIPERHIFVCTGDDCRKHGGKKLCKAFKEVLDERGLKRRIKVMEVDCLDQCANAPMALIYPDATWYAKLHEADVEEVVDRHLTAGKPVTEKLYRRVHGPSK
jgi:NADP-reducing hydrogenase subunit HndC